MTPILVALAGGAGAWGRFRLDTLVRRHARGPVPLGTLAINVTGSFALGLLTSWLVRHGGPDDLRAVLGTGLLGGYTTFSTATVEVATLLREGRWRHGIGLWLGMAALGLAAAASGLALGAL